MNSNMQNYRMFKILLIRMKLWKAKDIELAYGEEFEVEVGSVSGIEGVNESKR